MNSIIDNNKIKIIDKKNSENWELRYETPVKVIKESESILIQSEEISYKNGYYHAKLNISICKFLLSEHNENIISDLYDIIRFFETKEPEKGYVNALNLTANIFQSYGDYKKGLEICKKAQKIAINLNNEHILADNFSICGLIYSDIFDYDKAIQNFKKALKIREKFENKKAMASSLNLIARTNSLSENLTEALNYYNKALALRKKMNDIGGLPWTHIGLASTYEKINDYTASIKHYEIALKINEKFNDKRCKLHCFMGIGTVKSIISPSKIAEDYLIEAQKIAKELNAKAVLYNIYKKLSELYERMLDIPKAFAYFKLFQSSKDEVINSKLQNQLKNQEIIFAIEKTEKEAEIYRLKHVELKNAYELLEHKNKEITDSINYANNIQTALLPSKEYRNKILPEHFILFHPRDIVSGDFYWLNKKDDNIMIVVADCTGHGVPGAFMSMLGISFLNEIINTNKIIQPDLVLNELRNKVISSLNKTNREVSDGMDISLCLINQKTLKLEYAGAFNPLFVIRKNLENLHEIIQIDGDRMPIGLYIKNDIPFITKKFQLQKDDTIYMFSDGYPDQFGGPLERKQKFMKKRFKQLLTEIQLETMQEQHKILETKLASWIGNSNQTDDITVLGIRF